MIPFKLTESNARIPCLQVEIEGISFLAKLDIGYDGVLSLPKSLLQQLSHKHRTETVLFKGIKGKKYESPVFTLPELNIGDLALIDFPAEETNLEFEFDTTLRNCPEHGLSDVIARIGWRAFQRTVVLIDFDKGIGACCDSVDTLKEQGYPLEKFVSTDLFPAGQCVEFEADIDHRKVKCLLDTGSTLNLIHSPSIGSNTTGEKSEFGNIDFANPLPSTILSISGHELGPCVFHETQLPFCAEAIVGISFLKTQIVCIDLVNYKLYLLPILDKSSSDLSATPL